MSLADVSLTYPNGIKALVGVNLKLAHGDFVALVGPSGCGKSTLLRIVAGLLATTRGSVALSGAPTGNTRKQRMSFVFQSPTLLPWRNVTENVALPLELAGMEKRERRERARAFIAKVGLTEFAQAYPRELSGGMRMRVSLARALVTEPDLLLLDEPFGALDEMTREKLNEDLSALWVTLRMTVLFVTHNVYEAAFLGNRIAVMSARPGTIITEIAVPFLKPRRLALKGEPGFAALAARASGLLREGGAT